MSDPTTDGPTEEELRAYLDTLRDAQPVEVVVQAFGILATASEVKLGLADARILIDGMVGLLDATASRLPDTITKRMRDTISQLQMAQVQAERQPSPAASAEAPTQDRAAGQPAGQAPGGAAQQDGPTQQRQESPTSRLWIPGRD